MLSKPAQWQHMQRYHSFIVEMLLTPVISYFPLAMNLWKGLRSSRLISSCPKLCRPKFLVNLPLMLSYLAWNFIMLNNIVISLLHIYRMFFVSSRLKERGISLIHCSSILIISGDLTKNVRLQNNSFGQHNFERDDFRATWPITVGNSTSLVAYFPMFAVFVMLFMAQSGFCKSNCHVHYKCMQYVWPKTSQHVCFIIFLSLNFTGFDKAK